MYALTYVNKHHAEKTRETREGGDGMGVQMQCDFKQQFRAPGNGYIGEHGIGRKKKKKHRKGNGGKADMQMKARLGAY